MTNALGMKLMFRIFYLILDSNIWILWSLFLAVFQRQTKCKSRHKIYTYRHRPNKAVNTLLCRSVGNRLTSLCLDKHLVQILYLIIPILYQNTKWSESSNEILFLYGKMWAIVKFPYYYCSICYFQSFLYVLER